MRTIRSGPRARHITLLLQYDPERISELLVAGL
jgi:hypothetical protein